MAYSLSKALVLLFARSITILLERASKTEEGGKESPNAVHLGMEMVAKQVIRERVLEYLKGQNSPVGLRAIADNVRTVNNLREVRDSEVRNVVQSMIVTGKLNYAPGLKIELRKAAANTV